MKRKDVLLWGEWFTQECALSVTVLARWNVHLAEVRAMITMTVVSVIGAMAPVKLPATDAEVVAK